MSSVAPPRAPPKLQEGISSCQLCSRQVNHAEDIFVSVPFRCARHSKLILHLQCYLTASERVSCGCPAVAMQQSKRYPINHGDNLKCEPLWLDC
jgi:hypothetical protein